MSERVHVLTFNGEPVSTIATSASPATGHYIPICRDFDAECVDVVCKTTCFLHAPERGRCPYLRSTQSGRDST